MLFEIDNRESATIKEYFNNSKSYECSLKNLDQGDFIIRDSNQNILLLVERKTIEDLLASVKDNRYAEQSERYLKLNISNSKIYYIIEGNINRYFPNSTEYKTYYSCIYSLSFKKGFSVLLSNDIPGTINILEQFLSRINKDIDKITKSNISNESNESNESNDSNDSNENKEKEETSSVSLIKKQNITPQNIDSYMLNLVPGIGISTAKEILKHFDGKIYNLMKIFESNESNKRNDRISALNDIKINNRKISKKIVENINNYLTT